MSVESSTLDVGRSAPRGAVFLSYASQDVEAAKRIADALRGAGVEVWFDAEGGLEHGDEWDAKIRRQIKECVLFIPLISANTQAREEGYFRIEWELAAQRALGIASGVAFILPVLIDGTKEPEALVPDRFRSVQWTKLPGGNVPPDVLQRFLKLWSHRTGALKAMEAGRPRPAEERGDPAKAGPPPDNLKSGSKAYAFVAAAVAVLVAGLGWWLLRGSAPAAAAPVADLKSQVSNPSPAQPVSEALALANKAYAITQRVGFTREDLAQAEASTQKAIELEPDSARVRSIHAWVRASYLMRNWDLSSKRLQEVQTAANRALGLDPNDPDALNALAQVFEKQRVPAEAEKLARRAVAASADNYRGWLLLGRAQASQGHSAEARATLEQAVAKFPDNPLCRYELAADFAGLGNSLHVLTVANMTAAMEQLEAAIAIRPFASAILLKAVWEVACHGDLVRMRAELDRLDATAVTDRTEDRAVYLQMWAALLERRPDRVLAAAKLTARPYFEDLIIAGPKAWGTAHAYRIAGKEALARQEWEAAEAVQRQRLREQPNDIETVRLAMTLAWKGEAAEAARLVAPIEPAWREDLTKPAARDLARYYAAQGDAAKAVPLIREVLNYNSFLTDALLPLDPWWDKLRGQPEFEALLAEARARQQAEAGPGHAAAAKDDKSVAVLAFTNLSDDKDNEYFSDGVAEELLTVLQKIPGLRVAARTSAFSFKGQKATAQEIGEKLGVATLVEGSVRKAGNTVRITARLSRAATGEQLWSESYTRDLKDVFAVQSELAETIVSQLRGQLGGTATKAEIQALVQAAEKGGTKNVEAHELYLQGKYFLNRATLEDVARATSLLQRAIELDPEFALAWAALSGAGWFRGGYGVDRRDFEEGFALARRAADRALTIEPALVAGLIARLDLQSSIDFDWVASRETLRRVQQLAPNDPAVVFRAAQLAFGFGQLPRAEELSRQAAALDPVNPLVYTNRGYIFLALHRFDDAIAAFRRVQELSPASPWGHAGVAMALVASGRGDEAVSEGDRSTVEWSRLYSLALARWAQKNRPEADRVLAQFVGANADVAAYQIACVYAYRGEADKTFEWLERAYRQHDPGLGWGKQDYFLQALHADPRWDALMHKIGLADDQLK